MPVRSCQVLPPAMGLLARTSPHTDADDGEQGCRSLEETMTHDHLCGPRWLELPRPLAENPHLAPGHRLAQGQPTGVQEGQLQALIDGGPDEEIGSEVIAPPPNRTPSDISTTTPVARTRWPL